MKINTPNDARAEDLAVATASHLPARPPCRPHGWQGSGVGPRGGPAAEPPLLRASVVGKHLLESRRDEGVSTAPAPCTTRIAPPLLPTRTPCPRMLVRRCPHSPHSFHCFLAGAVYSRRSILWRRQEVPPALIPPALALPSAPAQPPLPTAAARPPLATAATVAPTLCALTLCLCAQSPLRKLLKAEGEGPPPTRRAADPPTHRRLLAAPAPHPLSHPPPSAHTPLTIHLPPPHNPIPHPRHLTQCRDRCA